MGYVADGRQHVIPLHGSINPCEEEPFVARVARRAGRPMPIRAQEVLVTDQPASLVGVEGFRAILRTVAAGEIATDAAQPAFRFLDTRLDHLDDGDIVRINPRQGEVSVFFRQRSEHNSIFLTERCNNFCLMCSQPPKDIDDGDRIADWFTAISLMPRQTRELGITGGEPTLLGDRFVDLIRRLKSRLPETRLHILSNGCLFRYLTFAQAVASVGHPDITVAVPLFSDLPELHDYIVQRRGAFDETIRGLLNLARVGIAVEIRTVIQKANASRLAAAARFIAVNLPFVSQVSLMALEPTGLAKANARDVWIDPADYGEELKGAVDILAAAKLNPVIMNQQLCVLDQGLWRFAAKSISDYKNLFLRECQGCSVTQRCAGFFESARVLHSAHIARIACEVESV